MGTTSSLTRLFRAASAVEPDYNNIDCIVEKRYPYSVVTPSIDAQNSRLEARLYSSLIGESIPVNVSHAFVLALKSVDRIPTDAEMQDVVEGLKQAFLKSTLNEYLACQPKVEELWEKRDKLKKESPPAFIMRVYEKWLERGITQAEIRQVDPKLYMALHNWLRNNEMPAELRLPSKKEMYDELLEKGVPSASESIGRAVRDADPEIRQRIKLYQVARKRARNARP